MGTPDFVYAMHVHTTPEKLWEALTTGAFTRQYWGGRDIESTWEVGAPVTMVKADGTRDFKGNVLVADAPKTLSYTFVVEAPTGNVDSKVTFQLDAMGPNVRLTLTHEGLPEGGPVRNIVSQGWFAILSSLKTLLETGAPLSFPYWKG